MGTRRTDRGGPQETASAVSEPKRAAASEPAADGASAVEPPQKATKDSASTMQQPPPRQRPRQKGATLDRSLQARIGSVLRESFNDIEREPLPDRLQDLIEELQAGDKGGKGSGAK
jgi:hypothetical protein